MGMNAKFMARFLSVEELEAMMLAALKEQAGGKSVVEWTMGDSSAKKAQWMNLPPSARMQDIGVALSIKDPDTYPPDEHIPITQTRVIFT